MIAVLDYGMGNLRSVTKALEHVGAEPVLTHEHALVREANGIVLPGVGAMPRAMERVRSGEPARDTPAPTDEALLLTEIRDLMQRQVNPPPPREF